ncbi:hypothetical protein FB45DRAFT_734019 [Roridomyces roridus]|uniref:SNF5-domain-containing protein n=1 Tax=Roridomyces roridus TaxID=1738132 RepID=A0AAD7CFZ3_9AGAR|nr:hypothetical protein FB45DRAFT_734019 [Roridomyces roridus]
MPPQNSFPPGSPYQRHPTDLQPQVLRSNSMGPPMMRPPSSEAHGYPRPPSSNGSMVSQPPPRPPSIPRSSSPVKVAPPTPTRSELDLPPIPPVAPPVVPAVVSAPSTLLPELNQAITRVTVVPLATSLTTIPPVSQEEIADVKRWMEADQAYGAVHRDMKTRMDAELREQLGGPQSIPWWEKGTLAMNASRFAHGRDKFEMRYPYRTRDRFDGTRKKGARREGLKLPRKLDPEDANRREELVPIRLEFDVEHHKIRDTFVWDMNAPVVGPEHFAQTVVEDYDLPSNYLGLITKSIQDQLSEYRAHSVNYEDSTVRNGTLDEQSAEWWSNWRKRLRTEYRGKGHKRRKVVKDEPDNERPMAAEEIPVNYRTLHEEMRIVIRLDIIVGSIKLDDQFEWDLDNPDASPEDFAHIYALELGLGGEFRTAIAHSIREQVHTYQKSLFLVGHPMDGTPIQDEDLRNSFLPSLSSGARSMDQVQSFTPLLNYLSDGEIERNEKEREKEYNKRRKKGRGGRRGVALPDREPVRTYRTPAIGFPEPDPATLAAAAAAAAPVSRRAAAAAASLTIANLVASENGGPSYSASLPSAPAPPPILLKEKTKKGFFKAPVYDNSILRPRARIAAPIPSTAADVSKLPVLIQDDPPSPPRPQLSLPPSTLAVPTSDTNSRVRPVSAKRAKELEREAKEKEFAEGQHANMIDGVWHCSNCGCPESIAVGRRKGPLGEKSQCGTCGKYWHRYRKPRPIEYNSDYDFHAAGLKKEVEVGKKRKGRPPLNSAVPVTPADTSEPQTPRDDGPSRQSPFRDVSPVSTVSSGSEAPLAQRIKINRTATPSRPPPSADNSTPLRSAPSSHVAPPVSPSVSTSEKHQLPPWLAEAMQTMQAEYQNDRFEAVLKVNATQTTEWRLKCLDCPGKV